MKTTIRVTAVALVLVMLVGILASCGTTLSGTYKTESILNSFVELEFKGSKVTVKTYTAGAEISNDTYKYKIKDDKITMIDEDETDEDLREETFTFEKDGDTIKIGSLGVFTKQ